MLLYSFHSVGKSFQKSRTTFACTNFTKSFQYGLYASIVPGFLYAIFGSLKEASIGPTAVNSLMAFEYASVNGVQMVHRCLTLSFFVGLIEISLGVLNLGNFFRL